VRYKILKIFIKRTFWLVIINLVFLLLHVLGELNIFESDPSNDVLLYISPLVWNAPNIYDNKKIKS